MLRQGGSGSGSEWTAKRSGVGFDEAGGTIQPYGKQHANNHWSTVLHWEDNWGSKTSDVCLAVYHNLRGYASGFMG